MKKSHRRNSVKQDFVGFGLITIAMFLISAIIFFAYGLIGETNVGKSTAPFTCGDNLTVGGELCDGTDILSKTCSDFGYSHGVVSCCKDCLGFNVSACSNQTHSCADYDNGTEYFVASYTINKTSTTYGPDNCISSPARTFINLNTTQDICLDSYTVSETSCSPDNLTITSSYACPALCKNGACHCLKNTDCPLKHSCKGGICTRRICRYSDCDGCDIGEECAGGIMAGELNRIKFVAKTKDNDYIIPTIGVPAFVNATKSCEQDASKGYTDWILPNMDELNSLCMNKDIIGNFTSVSLLYNYVSSITSTDSATGFTQIHSISFAPESSCNSLNKFYSTGTSDETDYLSIRCIRKVIPQICENDICDSTENCSTCPEDCGECQYCGDDFCDYDEDCGNCEEDCGECEEAEDEDDEDNARNNTLSSACGNNICGSNENCTSCEEDCGECPTCGNKVCSNYENCSTCPKDCGACKICGDKICNNNETCSTCPGDCSCPLTSIQTAQPAVQTLLPQPALPKTTVISSSKAAQKVLMEKEDIVQFVVANETDHAVTINRMNSTGIILLIESSPQFVSLTKQSPVKKIDVNDDGYYDIKITLLNLYSSSANIEFEIIHEKAKKNILGKASLFFSSIKSTGSIWVYLIIASTIIFILAGTGFVYYEKTRSSSALRSEMKKKALEGDSLKSLHNYVIHSLASGYSPERIEQRLLEEGWSKSIVESMLPKVK